MIISRNNRFSMGRYRSFLIAAAIFCGAFAAQAEPGAIEVVASNFGTGEFTLRVPSSEKPLELYWATAWADDTDEYSQWRAPVFLSNIPAGTTEVTVTVPGFSPDAASRFFRADPDNAVVTRPVTVIGGKDSSGHFNSAFVTGLHPCRSSPATTRPGSSATATATAIIIRSFISSCALPTTRECVSATARITPYIRHLRLRRVSSIKRPSTDGSVWFPTLPTMFSSTP